MTTTGSTKTGSTKIGYDGPYQTRPTLDNWTFPTYFDKGIPMDSEGNPIYVGPGGPNPTVGYPYIDDRFRPNWKPQQDPLDTVTPGQPKIPDDPIGS